MRHIPSRFLLTNLDGGNRRQRNQFLQEEGILLLGVEQQDAAVLRRLQCFLQVHRFADVPVHNMLNNLVYSADGRDVCLTMSDGKVLYRNGMYMTLDIQRTIAETEAATKKILSMI